MNSSNTHCDVHIVGICKRLALPSRVAALANRVLDTVHREAPYDAYYAYAAVYVAVIACGLPTPSISALLSLMADASGRGNSVVSVDAFFHAAKLVAADAAALLTELRSNNPPDVVHAEHRAYVMSAELWRKLTELMRSRGLIGHTGPEIQSVVWKTYLVSKALITAPSAHMSSVDSFHLLLSCIAALHIVRSIAPLSALCEATQAIHAEVTRFSVAIGTALPRPLLRLLPSAMAVTMPAPSLTPLINQLDAEYAILKAAGRTNENDRIFIDAIHLHHAPLPPVAPTPASSPAHNAEGLTTPRTPSRKRRAPSSALSTPRALVARKTDKVLTLPSSAFKHFSSHGSGSASGGSNALDALAAVACTTPRTPTTRDVGKSSQPPTTPFSLGCSKVLWLQNLADSRPETADVGTYLTRPAASVNTTGALKSAVGDGGLWAEIVDRVRNLAIQLQTAIPDETTEQQKREALAVYFAAIERILAREAIRMDSERERFTRTLLRNSSFHKGVLACAWETTSAAYGRLDSFVFSKSLDVFQVPPFEMTKVIEPFVRRLGTLPRSLSQHILTCEHRLLESTAWRKGSILVSALTERVRKARLQNSTVEGSTTDEIQREVPSIASHTAAPVVTEFALETFFRKLMFIASERTRDLLTILGVDREEDVEKVWQTLKVAVFQRWTLLVDRHLDQVLLCSIYAVCKVLKYSLKFKEIMGGYRSMAHVKAPSFAHLVATLSRDVSLDAHHNLVMPESDVNNVTRGGSQGRGDIIKYYNQVFIHAMKSHLVTYNTDPLPDAMVEQAPKGTGPLAHPVQGSYVAVRSSKSNTPTPRTDRLHQLVMNSPLRSKTVSASPRRYGRVTVTPMSAGKSLMALRQSPGRRTLSGASMTPMTRTLYSFGESPLKSLDRINRTLVPGQRPVGTGENGWEAGSKQRANREAIPLNFDGLPVKVRKENYRKRAAVVVARMAGREPDVVRSGGAPPGSPQGAPGRTVVENVAGKAVENADEKLAASEDGGEDEVSKR